MITRYILNLLFKKKNEEEVKRVKPWMKPDWLILSMQEERNILEKALVVVEDPEYYDYSKLRMIICDGIDKISYNIYEALKEKQKNKKIETPNNNKNTIFKAYQILQKWNVNMDTGNIEEIKKKIEREMNSAAVMKEK